MCADSGQQSFILTHSTISAGSSASLELENNNTDYQTTNTAEVVVIVQGNATTLTDFEIIEDSSADAGSGTQKEDFSAVSMSATEFITSKVLDIAASRYVTIKVNTGTVSAVTAILVESV